MNVIKLNIMFLSDVEDKLGPGIYEAEGTCTQMCKVKVGW